MTWGRTFVVRLHAFNLGWESALITRQALGKQSLGEIASSMTGRVTTPASQLAGRPVVRDTSCQGAEKD